MKFPKPNIIEVLEHLGGQVVSSRGTWRKARCPIHEDGSPSASVNEDDCRFNCFVCDFNGDAVDLIGRCLDLGQPDALAYCKEHFGDGDERVPGERVGRSELSRRPGNRGERGKFVPAWRRAL